MILRLTEQQLAIRNLAVHTIQSIGLNPDDISVEGLDVNGYEVFVRDENGNRVPDELEPDRLKMEWRAWPSPAIGLHITSLMIQSGWPNPQ